VAPTAFHDDRSLDLGAQGRLVKAAASWGADGVTAMGVTSEVSALTPKERSASLRAVEDAARDRVPLVIGCSGGSAEVVIDLIQEAAELGAVAAMVSAPPLFRDLDRLPHFFARVAAEGGLPLVIQDEPAATGMIIPVSVLLRCLEASGTRTVKLEDPPTAPKIAELLAADPGLRVFGGLGGVSALAELRAGSCGTMTGFAFPEVLRAVREGHEAGRPEAAVRLFDRYLPLLYLEAQAGIGLAIRKELLRRRGALGSAATRLGQGLDAPTSREIDDVLARLGISPSPEAFRPE
jgi:4-hydroxy-tetrahydrodipicolinate synthase